MLLENIIRWSKTKIGKAVSLAAFLGVLAGCSDSKPRANFDGGYVDGGVVLLDGGSDGGIEDGGPECQNNDDCSHLNKKYCQENILKEEEGRCVDSFCRTLEVKVTDCRREELYCGDDKLKKKVYGCLTDRCGQIGTELVLDCDNKSSHCNGTRIERDRYICLNDSCVFVRTDLIKDCQQEDYDFCEGTDIKTQRYSCEEADGGMDCGAEEARLKEGCDDGLYCNGLERCENETCVEGGLVDCSGNDLAEINSCIDLSDSNRYTKDTRAGLVSSCEERDGGYECTEGDATIEHLCDKAGCGAECDKSNPCEANSCSQVYEDRCEGRKLVEYNNNRILDSITVDDSCQNECLECICTDCEVDCSPPPIVSHYVKDVCGAVCEKDEDCGADALDYCEEGLCHSRKIAFASDRDVRYKRNLFMINANGTGNVAQITEGEFTDSSPVFSPDGEWIAFESDRARRSYKNIWKVRPDGSGLTQLTNNDQQNKGPAWSEEGIFFVSDNGKTIYGIDGDGRNPYKVIETPTEQGFRQNSIYHPAVCGDWIFFQTFKESDGYFSIWKVRPDGSDLRAVISDRLSVDPACSSEGKIAFVARCNNIFRCIYIADDDGSNITQLTNTDDSTTDYSPVFSPDGSWLAFGRGTSLGYTVNADIWIVKTDGSNLTRRRTYDLASDVAPVWFPR